MTENEYDAICKKARYLEALHDEIFKLKADLESLRDTNNELSLNIILVTKKGWDFHAKIKADIATLPTYMLLQELLRREGCQEEYSEWHSAKDMMPSDSEDVIVLKENGCISFAHRVSCLDEVQNWDGWNISGVAFWMPFRPSKEMLEYYHQETDLK